MPLPDAAELKKLAKQLQTAPNPSVRTFFALSVPRRSRFVSGTRWYSGDFEERLSSNGVFTKGGYFIFLVPCLILWELITARQESKIGLAVGKLRTHSAKDVSDLAK